MLRLTRKAYSLLRKKYLAILSCCHKINLLCALALLVAAPASAANLSISAQGGSATISNGGVYQQINITGAANPTINITQPLTITGPGNRQPVITSATSAHMRVINTVLNLGSDTVTNGGTLRGDIFFDHGTLQVYGDEGFMVHPFFNITSGGDSTGTISGNGTLIIKPHGYTQTGAIGESPQPLSSVSVEEGGRLQFTGGIHADRVTISEASMAALSGDIHISTLDLNGVGSSIQAELGDIYIDNLESRSPDNELFAQTGINAETGSIHISGDLDLSQGLTAIRAGKDISIANGAGSIKGPGKLYLHAGGHVTAGRAIAENSNLEALRMTIGEDLVAKSVFAAQISAGTVQIGDNLEIQGNSADIFGTKVDYGLLEIRNNGNKIGGDLRVFDAKIAVPDITIGKNAIFSAVEGTFNTLSIGGELDFAAGMLTGDKLTAHTINLGESQYTTTLNVREAGFGSLVVGRHGVLNTDKVTAPNGSILLQNGGQLNLASGDLGTLASPLNSITLGQDSHLESPGSIYARSLAGLGAQGNNLTAINDIRVYGPISGNLNLTAGNTVSATTISANSLKARNAVVMAGSLTLREPSEVMENLTIIGASGSAAALDTPQARNQGSFTSLKVGDTLTLTGSGLTGQDLTAKRILLGGSANPSTLRVNHIASGFGIGIGRNAWASFGDANANWLPSVLAGSAYANSSGGVLGVYNAITVGSTGVRVDGGSSIPIPQTGQLDFAPDSLLVVNGERAREAINPYGIIRAETPMQARVQAGARLLITNVAANNVYGVLGHNITTTYDGPTAWDETRIETGSHLLGLRKIEGRNGWFATQAKDPETVYPGIDPGLKPPLIEGNGGGNSQPGTPNRPAQPGQTPSIPSGPGQPSQPGQTPSTPSGSGQPSQPGQTPSTPSGPDQPSQPGQTPSTPSGPSQPSQPGQTPSTPSGPDQPSQPVAPGQPAEPDSSGTLPGVPGVGQLPGQEPALGTEDRHFNSDYAGIRFLSRVTSTKYMDHNYNLAWKTLESAARMAVLAAVPQLTYAANMAAVDAAEGRSAFNAWADSIELEANRRAWALWITPLYRNLQGHGLEAYNLNYDFSGGLGGIVLGGDLTFGDNLRVGLDASLGGGYAKSGGDLAETTNNMGFAGIGAYAGWQPGNYGFEADIHFTSTWNSIRQEFPAELEMRNPTGELTARALSAGFRAEYRMPIYNTGLTHLKSVTGV